MAADGDVVLGGGRPDRVVLRVAPRRPRFGLDQRSAPCRGGRPTSRSRGPRRRGPRWPRRSSRASARASCSCCPASARPARCCARRTTRRWPPAAGTCAWVGSRTAMSAPASMIGLPERQVRVAAGELAVVGEGVHPHRVGVGVVGGVVVDQLADPVVHEVLAAQRLRDVLLQHAAAGHRVDVGVDAADRNALGGSDPLLDVCQSHRGLLSSRLLCVPRRPGCLCRRAARRCASTLSRAARPSTRRAGRARRRNASAGSSSRTSACRPCR